MANKPTKPIRLPQQTKEEQEMQVARFFANKREQFAINILANSVRGEAFLNAQEGVKIVDTAVAMADHLLEKLYPVVKEDKK